MKQKINIIVGPTASGKSSFGLRLAEKIKGEIINADSMQVYQDLKILSARPLESEMNGITHHLYGYLGSHEKNSAYDWLKKAIQIIQKIENPILIGGTGLYIDILMNGISPIPPIDLSIREKVRQMDINEVRQQVKNCFYHDSQRLRRALEVQLSTGKPLSYFQDKPKIKEIDADFKVYFINPPREKLYEQCDSRFEKMLQNGAIEEVKHLLEMNATGGVMKAIGVEQIISYLYHECDFHQLCETGQRVTRHYAKRQVTWFTHQIKDKTEVVNPEEFVF